MITLDEKFVDSIAPNAEAAKNGRGLVLKGKFNHFHKSQDESVIFGKCQGSGKEPYRCSCDFARPDQPTYRCNCPSRQFPCKHCLGLMYAYAQGKPFTTAEVPEDLQAKREKLQERKEKQKTEEAKPKQVNKSALAKKIQAQLAGLDVLEQMTADLIRVGVGNMSAKSAAVIAEQAKQLGDAFLPGAQSAVLGYLRPFLGADGAYVDGSAADRERIFGESIDRLGRLHSLVKQGRTYLNRYLQDPDLKPDTSTGIAAWLGHAWQLRELKDAGLVETDVELMQLAFNTHDDVARREFVDTGVWMSLANGKIRLTQTYRPYKAVKFIKSDDSFFGIAQVAELCVYPGEGNTRIRWDAMNPRAAVRSDFERVRSHSAKTFATVVKDVRGLLKSPLADKQPIAALTFQRIGTVGDATVIEDADGDRLILTDTGMSEEPPSCHLLPLLPESCRVAGTTMIVRFRHDLDARKLQVKPLSIVTDSAVVRLTL